MNWQHLIYFLKVAEKQNFTQAANELYITPSALSKAISALEEELQFPLFYRIGRNSMLSDYGMTFKKYVEESVECIENGIKTIHTQMNLMKGSLNICGIYTLCSNYLPLQIKEFVAMYPDVDISLEYHISIEDLERVISGQCELGFCADFDFTDKKYDCLAYQLLKQEEMVIITSKTHPLATRSEICLHELENEQFILNSNQNTRNRMAFLDVCQRYSFEPQIAFETPDDQSLFGMVIVNLGITFMADIPNTHHGSVHILRIKDIDSIQSHYIVWRKKPHLLSHIAKAFRDYIISTIED